MFSVIKTSKIENSIYFFAKYKDILDFPVDLRSDNDVFKCENTIFMLLNSKIFFPYGLRENKGKLRIPYGKGFGSEFAYGKGFCKHPPPHPGRGCPLL